MNKSLVWWTLVNSSATLIKSIADIIADNRNVLLCCESKLPWKNTFYELTRNALAEISAQRRLEYLSAAYEDDPGRFIMMKMCPQSVRSEYWPDMTYAEFLAAQSDIVLNHRIVWIKDIEDESHLEKWFDFISDYNKFSQNKNHECALFIVEYTGNKNAKTPPKELSTVMFSPTFFDRYIFCLSMLSELNEPFEIKQYISELVCCLGKEDNELCGLLAGAGMRLIQTPDYCIKELIPTAESDEIHSCVLMAQIKIIFPIIEQFRLQFIKNHEDKISSSLPIVNAFGESIDEPSELELSDLCSISRKYNSGFTDEEKKLLLKYKNYRNMLAHNDTISWREVELLLNS